MSTPGGLQFTVGHHEYIKGYSEYSGGCSVYRGNIMSTVGAYHECGRYH